MIYLDAVVSYIATSYGFSAAELRGRARTARVSRARQLAVAALIELDATLVEVGQILGKRDHTTIMYLRDQAAQVVARDELAAQVVAAAVRRAREAIAAGHAAAAIHLASTEQ